MSAIFLVLTVFWMGEAQQPLVLEEKYTDVEGCATAGHIIANKLIQHPNVTQVAIRCMRGDTT